MSNPTKEELRNRLEKHIRMLICQPIVDYQVRNNVRIESITIHMREYSMANHVNNVIVELTEEE
jgi:hypothetical protein